MSEHRSLNKINPSLFRESTTPQVKLQLSICFINHNTTKPWKNGGTAPYVLNLGARSRWVVTHLRAKSRELGTPAARSVTTALQTRIGVGRPLRKTKKKKRIKVTVFKFTSVTFKKHQAAKKPQPLHTGYSTSIPAVLSLCPLDYGRHRHHRLFFLQHLQSQQRSHFPEITTKCVHIKTHRTNHTNRCTPRAALGSTGRCSVQPLGRSPARLDNFLAPHSKNDRRQAQKRHTPSKTSHTTVINGPRTIRDYGQPF